jgi:pyruvate/2-oxoglutarate dehydrogenase complex dihydrolipoamide dehydrogenase (E3) component
VASIGTVIAALCCFTPVLVIALTALGLSDMGVTQAKNGGIVVDDHMRTTRPGIYTAGDVTGHDLFVYMAAYGANIAAKNALNDDGLSYDNATMQPVVFPDPQVASVGLTEKAARDAGYEVRVSTIGLNHVLRALVRPTIPAASSSW